MSYKYDLKIVGTRNLANRLTANRLHGAALRVFADSYSKAIAESAKTFVPVDSGKLRQSIYIKKERSAAGIPKVVEIGARAKHAPFVHGTGPRFKVTKPYARTRPHWPPLKAIKKWGPVQSGQIPAFMAAKAISEKGTPLVPFLVMAEKTVKTFKPAIALAAVKAAEASYKRGKRGKLN